MQVQQGDERAKCFTHRGLLAQHENDRSVIGKPARLSETQAEVIDSGRERRNLEQLDHGTCGNEQVRVIEKSLMDTGSPYEGERVEIESQRKPLEIGQAAASDDGGRRCHAA